MLLPAGRRTGPSIPLPVCRVSCAMNVVADRMAAMRAGKSWWPWVVAVIVVAGLTLLLVVTVLPLGGREGLQDSANTAHLTALIIAAGAAGLGAMAWAWRTTKTVATVPATEVLAYSKDVLAVAVERQWKDEARLRSLDDPDPIPVCWRTPVRSSAATLMDHPANVESGTGSESVRWTVSSADIAALGDRFRRTRRRRLVILGGPGTGKTTLAMQLLLHLLDTRRPARPHQPYRRIQCRGHPGRERGDLCRRAGIASAGPRGRR